MSENNTTGLLVVFMCHSCLEQKLSSVEKEEKIREALLDPKTVRKIQRQARKSIFKINSRLNQVRKRLEKRESVGMTLGIKLSESFNKQCAF